MRLALLALFVLFPLGLASPALAQTEARPDSVTPPVAPGPHGLPEQPPRIYFGGSIGLAFGSYTRISVQPMFGYRLGPKVSAGGRVAYEYLKNTSGGRTYESHSYGGSVFTRYRFIPKAYGQVEFQGMNYAIEGDREWVPFLLMGGGYVQPIDRRTSAYVEVLFDVLQNENSPYGWDPVVNAGVAVGF